jgi:hypothetical protein
LAGEQSCAVRSRRWNPGCNLEGLEETHCVEYTPPKANAPRSNPSPFSTEPPFLGKGEKHDKSQGAAASVAPLDAAGVDVTDSTRKCGWQPSHFPSSLNFTKTQTCCSPT